MVLAPEGKTVGDGERQDPSPGREPPVQKGTRHCPLANPQEDKESSGADEEADPGEGERRKVLQPKLDEEPRRAPDRAKKEPDKRRSLHVVTPGPRGRGQADDKGYAIAQAGRSLRRQP